nr:type II toxin-antitoxin system HicA family toxin [Candidatus Sigynarchaeota archaeon]
MRIRDAIKLIEDDGWNLVTVKGSHRQYKHPVKSGRVTIAGHPNHDLSPGTLNGNLKQAGNKHESRNQENDHVSVPNRR